MLNIYFNKSEFTVFLFVFNQPFHTDGGKEANRIDYKKPLYEGYMQ